MTKYDGVGRRKCFRTRYEGPTKSNNLSNTDAFADCERRHSRRCVLRILSPLPDLGPNKNNNRTKDSGCIRYFDLASHGRRARAEFCTCSLRDHTQTCHMKNRLSGLPRGAIICASDALLIKNKSFCDLLEIRGILLQ